MKVGRALPVLGVLCCILGVPRAQSHIDATLGGFRAQQEVLYLWSPKHVRRLFPGFENLAADLYWLRTVQYFGGQRLFAQEKRFELLYPLIEITTGLDERLEIAYRYGATFLSEAPPFGAGRPHEGAAILQRGATALPHSWRLRQDLGFFHFLYLRDATRASEILLDASKIPGAPFWLRSLAADLLAKGGERAMARKMWKEMDEQAEEGILRANAQLWLQIFDALDQADHLTALVGEYHRKEGRRPASLEDLGKAGLSTGPVFDTTGVPFLYDAQSGVVRVSPRSPLWRPEL